MVLYKIVSLHGRSGAGKTFVANSLREQYPESFRSVPSYTTRQPREGDEPSYVYVSGERFQEIRQAKEFAWTAQVRGQWYGTRLEDLNDALFKNEASLMILTPPIVARFDDLGFHPRLRCHLYLLSPSERKLRARLIGRGDDPLLVETSLAENSGWDRWAKSSGLPFIFIPNGSKVELLERVESALMQRGVN